MTRTVSSHKDEGRWLGVNGLKPSRPVGALAELGKNKLMVMQVDAPLIKGTHKHLFSSKKTKCFSNKLVVMLSAQSLPLFFYFILQEYLKKI